MSRGSDHTSVTPSSATIRNCTFLRLITSRTEQSVTGPRAISIRKMSSLRKKASSAPCEASRRRSTDAMTRMCAKRLEVGAGYKRQGATWAQWCQTSPFVACGLLNALRMVRNRAQSQTNSRRWLRFPAGRILDASLLPRDKRISPAHGKEENVLEGGTHEN